LTWTVPFNDLGYGIAVDRPGNSVYLAAAISPMKIRKYTSAGTFVTEFGEADAGGYIAAAVNSAGTSVFSIAGYTANANVNSGVRRDSTGAGADLFWEVAPWGKNVRGVAVDGSGNTYFTDASDHLVRKFDSSNALVTSWPCNNAYGIAVDPAGSFVYVATAWDNVIRKYDSNGVFQTQWACGGFPTGVAVDNGGRVFVIGHSDRAEMFTTNGVLLTDWDGGDSGMTFSVPDGIAVDFFNHVYVLDTGNNRVLKFSY